MFHLLLNTLKLYNTDSTKLTSQKSLATSSRLIKLPDIIVTSEVKYSKVAEKI